MFRTFCRTTLWHRPAQFVGRLFPTVQRRCYESGDWQTISFPTYFCDGGVLDCFRLFMATGNPFMQSANTTMTVPATCETATYIVTSADPALSSKSNSSVEQPSNFLLVGIATSFVVPRHNEIIFERVNGEKESVRSCFQTQIVRSISSRINPSCKRSCETVTAGDRGRDGGPPA